MSPKVVSTKNRKVVLIANVEDAPFKCIICRKVFISEPHLGRHYNRRHPSSNISQQSWASKAKMMHNGSEQNSIKAVLNATERIEYLLASLTYKNESRNKVTFPQYDNKFETFLYNKSDCINKTFTSSVKNNLTSLSDKGQNVRSPMHSIKEDRSEKTFDVPLADSTHLEINSDSLEDIGSFLPSREISEVSSDELSDDLCKSLPSAERNGTTLSSDGQEEPKETSNVSKEKNSLCEKKIVSQPDQSYSCLEADENEILRKVISSKPKLLKEAIPNSSVCSIQRSPTESEISHRNTSFERGSSIQNETLAEVHARLKNVVISKFNDKLRSYGVDPNWQTIPDKTAFNVGNILKKEREAVRTEIPDYNKLRELINHNANTRIKMSLNR